MKLKAIWKSDWFIGCMLTLLFAFSFQQGNSPLHSLENSFYDISTNRSTTADKQITIINISSENLRETKLTIEQALAFSINKLTQANVIGITNSLDRSAQKDSNINALIKAIQQSGNTLLPIHFDFNTNDKKTALAIPSQLKNTALQHIHPATISATHIIANQVSLPNQYFTQAAAGLGHTNIISDNDGITRHEAMVISYGDAYFPSLTLMLAASALGISAQDIRINMGTSIELGPLSIATDLSSRILPLFFQKNHQIAFKTYTFLQLHSGNIPSGSINDKIVLINHSAQNPDSLLHTPADSISQTEFKAHALQSILQDRMNRHPSWALSVELGLFIMVGLYLIFILPRMTTRAAIISSGLTFLTLICSDLFLLQYHSLWLQSISAALLLLIGHIAFSCKQLFSMDKAPKKVSRNRHETNKKLGISFQNQGMLDQAFEKFTACPIDDDILLTLVTLAQTFEHKRQWQQATRVYQYIAKHEPNYPDIQNRIQSCQQTQTTPDDDPNTSLSNLLITGKHKPTLGRYEIINELGKGAMGTVYLGKDPKINRKVAIKTMALSKEFKPQELEEVKAKFFHEAEIAGMLNHPNIVTIFDAGDEQDLAYIAMEFLDGVDLSIYSKKSQLLPFPTILKIVAKVAEALQYAHDHDVIHRDIKPANIMVLKNKTVKVTDFGIAHIIDTSKTKAGVVLGTPSYMSPEQLSGKKLDGRSDLFSLGVMLYELSCGTRPFRAESISKLMYKIAKQPHIDVHEHNPEVPDCMRLLINQLLAKKANQRINTAAEVLQQISTCLRNLNKAEKQ